MSAPVSRPVSPGNPSHGFAWKAVVVLSVDLSRRVATCVDDFGKYLDIRCDIMRAKGNLPERNEQWLVTREFGIWTFAAIINGTTRGVEVSNVTDLPQEIDRIDDANAAIRQDTMGKIVGKGDLLIGVSAGQVVRMPVGNLNESLVADPSSSTGVAYRDVTGRPVGYSGLAPATAAGRWVGTTTAGSPTSGTWQVGDWVNTQTGYRWVCTVAGTPGTWVERTSALETRVTTLENAPAPTTQRIVARSYIIASTPVVGNQALSTGQGYVRCYGPVKAGRLYRIGSMNMHLAADNVPVRVNAGLRISTDGTNTNTGGSLFQQTGTVIQSATSGGTNRPEPAPITAFYTPSVDCTLSISLIPSSGSTVGGVYPGAWIFASNNFGVDTFIEDMGLDPGA